MAMHLLFANNASSRLPAAIAAIDTAIRVQPGDGSKFPNPGSNETFTVTLEDRRSGQVEICMCTARSGDIMTVVRGQEATTAQAFAMGATVSNRLTAETMTYLSAGIVPETPASILAKLIQVDGAGSGLDADLLDGQHGTFYLDRTNHTGTQAESTITNLVPDLAAKAPLASPVFIGNPTAPTPTAADNSTSVATTSYVKAQGYLTAANGVTNVTGTAPVISSGGTTPVISMPPASNVASGHLTSADWNMFNGKQPLIIPGTATQYYRGDKTFQTLDKAAVGLANVDNTADISKPVSTPQQTALNLKADLASPTFTGNPTAPTPTVGDADTSIATTAFVATALSSIVGGAIISDTAPVGPKPGQLWFESDSGNTFIWYNDGDSQQWVQVNVLPPPDTTRIIPAGSIMDFAGAAAPAGWLMCYGQAVKRGDYPALFSALGTAFGSGDGSTTFNLPDCRGRVVAGKDDMGGTSADRITAFNGDLLGASGGVEAQALTLAQLPSHTHDYSAVGVVGGISANHTHAFSGSWNSSTASVDHAHGPVSGGVFASNVGSAWLTGGAGNVICSQGSTNSTGAAHVHGTSISGNTGYVSSDHVHSVSVSGTTVAAGSGATHNNLQPTIVFNKIIKT